VKGDRDPVWRDRQDDAECAICLLRDHKGIAPALDSGAAMATA